MGYIVRGYTENKPQYEQIFRTYEYAENCARAWGTDCETRIHEVDIINDILSSSFIDDSTNIVIHGEYETGEKWHIYGSWYEDNLLEMWDTEYKRFTYDNERNRVDIYT